jgi:hypothetical protein
MDTLEPRKNLPLKQLQAELALAMERMRAQPESDKEAIATFARWSEEITAMCGRGACGPTMDPMA